jgi:hypothetical protein
VVLYGRGTWSLRVREEPRLRVFGNRMLRKIFGPKRDGKVGGWRTLHNNKLHNLYSSLSKIRMMKSWWMRWAGNVACMGVEQYFIENFGGKARRKETIRKT